MSHEKASKLVKDCISKLSQSGKVLTDKEVGKLLQSFVEASGRLDDTLKSKIISLQAESLQGAALRTELQKWLLDVQSACWLPLQGSTRIAFREFFCAKTRAGLAVEIESSLRGGKQGQIDESLKKLAALSVDTGKDMADAALIYRLLECFSSRVVDVSDLWKTFCDCFSADNPLNPLSMDAIPLQSTLKTRFGHGLLALHGMGLISPQASGRAEAGTSLSHWRLRKRHFGRVWLKGKASFDAADIDALCGATPVPEAAELHQALMCGNSDAQEPKEIPAWAQRFLPPGVRNDGQLPSFLKRQAPRGYDPSAKRGKGVDKSRPRIFMGE